MENQNILSPHRFSDEHRAGLYQAVLSRRDVRGQFKPDPVPADAPGWNNQKSNFSTSCRSAAISKNLPANTDAERAVLAAILLNDENLTLVSDLLKPSDFFVRQVRGLLLPIDDLRSRDR